MSQQLSKEEIQLINYNEAKEICSSYYYYVGDKRRLGYKILCKSVIDIYMHRMNNFGKKLGLPTYQEYFNS